MLSYRIRISNKSYLKNSQGHSAEPSKFPGVIEDELLRGSWHKSSTDPNFIEYLGTEFVLNILPSSQVNRRLLDYFYIYDLGKLPRTRGILIGVYDGEISYVDQVIYYSKPLSEAEKKDFLQDFVGEPWQQIKIKQSIKIHYQDVMS